MKHNTTPSLFDRIAAAISLGIISFLVLETYLLPPETVTEVFDRYVQTTNRVTISRSYTTIELLTYQGGRYLMPRRVVPIKYDDTIYLDKSCISHSVLSVTYPLNGRYYKKLIGLINSNQLLPVLMLIASLFSAGVLSGRVRAPETIHYLQLMILICVSVVGYLFIRY